MVDLSKLNPFKSNKTSDKKEEPKSDNLAPSASKSSIKSLKDGAKKAIASAGKEPPRPPFRDGDEATPNRQAGSIGTGVNPGLTPVRSGGLM